MAGRSYTRARVEAEAERLAEARALPSEPRTEPLAYSPEIIPELIALADRGLADSEIAAHWCLTEAEIKEWEKAHIEFGRAMAQARTRAKAWWERSARLAMAERDTRYPAGLFSHVMRARFPEYDDKTSATVHIDLGSLVVIQRAEPPGKRTDDAPSALIEHASVRLAGSQTARSERLAPMSAPSGDPGAALSSADPASPETDQPAPSNHPRGA